MLKDLGPGDVFPDFALPDENGRVHRLSTLQGDDAMVLMLGRGEHCPRERQHQREMLRFHE
jgi:peroxiredoxin